MKECPYCKHCLYNCPGDLPTPEIEGLIDILQEAESSLKGCGDPRNSVGFKISDLIREHINLLKAKL